MLFSDCDGMALFFGYQLTKQLVLHVNKECYETVDLFILFFAIL